MSKYGSGVAGPCLHRASLPCMQIFSGWTMETSKIGSSDTHVIGETEDGGDGRGLLLLDPSSPSCPAHLAGGKGHNLWELGRMAGCLVPPWFCITTDAFSSFIEVSRSFKEKGVFYHNNSFNQLRVCVYVWVHVHVCVHVCAIGH